QNRVHHAHVARVETREGVLIAGGDGSNGRGELRPDDIVSTLGYAFIVSTLGYASRGGDGQHRVNVSNVEHMWHFCPSLDQTFSDRWMLTGTKVREVRKVRGGSRGSVGSRGSRARGFREVLHVRAVRAVRSV